MPEPLRVEARSLAAAAQTSPTWTRWMLVALAPAGSRQDFAALRGRVARRRALDWAAPLACGGSFEEAASAVLTGLPRGNAKRPSEHARASNAARYPPSTASEKVTPHFPSCRALQLTTSKLDSRAALPRWPGGTQLSLGGRGHASRRRCLRSSALQALAWLRLGALVVQLVRWALD